MADFGVAWAIFAGALLLLQIAIYLAGHFVVWSQVEWPGEIYWVVTRVIVLVTIVPALIFAIGEN